MTANLPVGFAVVSGDADASDRKSIVGLGLAVGLAIGLPAGFASVGFAFPTVLIRWRVA